MFFKLYLKKYKLSDAFKLEFDDFFAQLQERDAKFFGKCDLELVALCSKINYRKGLGTALFNQFLIKAQIDETDTIRLFTNTLASYQFYDKHGFRLVASKQFKDGSENKSLVYEYKLK